MEEYPDVTAKSFAIMNSITGKILYSKEANSKREIASLTKIMTCYVCLNLIEKFSLNINKLIFKVSLRAQNTIGTSSDLKHNEKVDYLKYIYR